MFPHLFSPFRLKATDIRNRIFSTGHDTYLPEAGLPSEADRKSTRLNSSH